MGISADSKSANQGTGKRAEVFFFLTFSFPLISFERPAWQNPYFSKKKRNKKGFKCFGSYFCSLLFCLAITYVAVPTYLPARWRTHLTRLPPLFVPRLFICPAFPSFFYNSHFRHVLPLFTNKYCRRHESHSFSIFYSTHKWGKTKQARAPPLLPPPHATAAPSSSCPFLRLFLPPSLLSLLLPTGVGSKCDRRCDAKKEGKEGINEAPKKISPVGRCVVHLRHGTKIPYDNLRPPSLVPSLPPLPTYRPSRKLSRRPQKTPTTARYTKRSST